MLKVKDLSIKYGEEKPLFEGLGFSIGIGKSIAIYGSNGSGKTSLLNALIGLIPEKIDAELKGEIKYYRKHIKDYNRSDFMKIVGFITTGYEDTMVFYNVSDELAFSLENLKYSREDIEFKIIQILTTLEIYDLKDKKIKELSSGQKALVNIAAALIVNPTLILCDEVFRHLDDRHRELVWNELNRLKNNGHSLIIVDQSYDNISRCDDSICLDLYRKANDDRA